MGYFPVRYDSRVINFERKVFIRLATGIVHLLKFGQKLQVLINSANALGESFWVNAPSLGENSCRERISCPRNLSSRCETFFSEKILGPIRDCVLGIGIGGGVFNIF